MFPLLKRETVDVKGWISEEEMVDYYALGQSIPGIIAVNTATLIGYRKRGMAGALVSVAGMALPSVVVILAISFALVPYFDLPVVKKAFSGIRAAVVSMIVMAVVQIGKRVVGKVNQLLIALASFSAIVVLQVHPILVILAGSLLGMVLFRKDEAK